MRAAQSRVEAVDITPGFPGVNVGFEEARMTPCFWSEELDE